MVAVASILGRDGMRRWATDELSTPERILIAARHFDWWTSGDMYDALDFDQHQRHNASAHLGRMVKRGVLELRGDGAERQYRLAVP